MECSTELIIDGVLLHTPPQRRRNAVPRPHVEKFDYQQLRESYLGVTFYINHREHRDHRDTFKTGYRYSHQHRREYGLIFSNPLSVFSRVLCGGECNYASLMIAQAFEEDIAASEVHPPPRGGSSI